VALVTGKGVQPEKAHKALEKVAGEMLPGEEAWLFARCNNFKPMTDAVVVTNARVLGLGTGGGTISFAALFDEVAYAQGDERRGSVTVGTHDGRSMTFKQLRAADVPAVTHYLETGRQKGVPEPLRAAAEAARAARPAAGDKEAAKEEKRKRRAEENARKQQQRAEEKARKEQGRADREAEELARYGRVVLNDVFGGRTVRVYEYGYVRVSVPLLGRNAPFERLVSIEASSDVGKKSALGRGAGAVATMGLNLATSNKRGDVYLTITTDRTTHVLHEDPPTAGNMRTAKRLEASGRSVIGRRPPTATTAPPAPTSPPAPSGDGGTGSSGGTAPADGTADRTGAGAGDRADGGGGTLAERLRELEALRAEGLVSAEEYERARQRLLESL
jgi:uncharacterized FlaG/YvyC family protein